ncbi:hypothetical protein [Chromobacterium haemolyticum]|uniref:hypothetical protein n=1 Tax=Chromobacterium haemolyticum TaxID=394935 RepID=UPI001177DB1B|nr:hypothetical protein [Chromobacterium haemolyticum]
MKPKISSPFVPRGFGNYSNVNSISSGAISRGNLFLWDPSYFTDPKNYVQGNQFKFIVHALDFENSKQISRRLLSGEDSILTSWDTISASLISDVKSFTYGSLGVILTVPIQNIILTSSEDMMFRNNIGDLGRSDFDLVSASDSLYQLSPVVRSGLLSKHVIFNSRKHSIRTPSEILGNTYDARNEIIIITRPNINTHPGYPTTREVKVSGVFIREMSEQYSRIGAVTEMLKFVNDKYPIIKIPGRSDQDYVSP